MVDSLNVYVLVILGDPLQGQSTTWIFMGSFPKICLHQSLNTYRHIFDCRQFFGTFYFNFFIHRAIHMPD